MNRPHKPWWERPHSGVRVVDPAEVLEQAKRERRVETFTTPPRRDTGLPWWYSEYLSGGTEIGVGENRALVAAAARKEACRALGISKYDLPPLQFRSYRPPNASDDLPAWFEPSLSGGVVCILARQSLVLTATAGVHETVHYHQSRKLGPLVNISRLIANNPSHPLEREARNAHQDFERYLGQGWGVYDGRLYDEAAIYWAQQQLLGHPRAEWTAPAGLLT
jgi:hypothetical protein